MRVIGVTGGIACGKSTVCAELHRQGFPVVDGDRISHDLTGRSGRAVAEIRSVFGDEFILPNGALNRQKMGRLVFSDPRARERLDTLMAPYLRDAILSEIESARSSGHRLCFLDLPLLFEKGYDSLCDTVWCVWLPEEMQLSRLMERDGCTRQEALARIRSAMSADEKANLSSSVIDNSGPPEDTAEQVSFLLRRELERGTVPSRRRRSASPPSATEQAPVSSQRRQVPVPAASPGPAAAREPFREVKPSPVAGPAPVPGPSEGVERSDSFRRKPSSRKSSWPFPRWMKVVLISLSAVVLLSLTAKILMDAWLVQRHQQHQAEQESIDAHYPLYYQHEITGTASEYNLSPALVASVVLNESSFNPEAMSSVGARGLMQLMPDTAEWIAHKLRVDGFQFEMVLDPAVNIRFGCWYLDYLSSLFHGDPLCVVCAYHAGQGEISSWLSNPLYSSDGKTLIYENLPDGPTKTYAGRVTRDYGIYQSKYFTPDPGMPADAAAVAD